ncbi:MAG TPA: CarD family transcriptional regulator [Pyrinomonadaceae bacterium]|jgi:CarD family transcriptional regulator|nr:CarD family transcriptional regulator [Pyrinomonadaceae bacterium]
MELSIGQKVAYPNQGVCTVEEILNKDICGNCLPFYSLRVLNDNSLIFVPVNNAESVGIRPIISSRQCKRLIRDLEEDFENISGDWKIRSREFTEKLQSGSVFEAADVLKKLTFLSHEKKLSFREQTLLEKAKFLIVSEIATVDLVEADTIAPQIAQRVEAACTKHLCTQPKVMAVSI